MATRLLRSAVAGLALRRSASLRLSARTPLSPVSAVSFSSNSAGARFEKHHIDENNDESVAARRGRKQERQVISRSRAGDYGDSYWVLMDGLWDYARSSRGSSTRQDSTTNSSSSSSSSISTPKESDVSSPSSEDLKESSWSWGSGDSSYSGGGDSFDGGDFFLGD